jgi:phosphorylcholine metabolism protein LicD
MIVVRSPLVEMNDETDSPEIAPRFHRSLRYWMMYRAYSKQDSQANDPKKAMESLAMFEQEFGQKSSAINETWIEREQMEFDGTF